MPLTTSFFLTDAGDIYIGPNTIVDPFTSIKGPTVSIPFHFFSLSCMICDARQLPGTNSLLLLLFRSIHEPQIIGANSHIRTGARLRGMCLFGDRVVVGGEVKSSVLMDEASFPHQCYLGDSICVTPPLN